MMTEIRDMFLTGTKEKVRIFLMHNLKITLRKSEKLVILGYAVNNMYIGNISPPVVDIGNWAGKVPQQQRRR